MAPMITNEPSFYIEITTGSVYLTKSQIWPDDDGPKYPTSKDVEALIRKCGGAANVAIEWALDYDMEAIVTDGPGVIQFPPKEQMKIGETE